MANVVIRNAVKDNAWFSANTTLVLELGRIVFKSGTLTFVRGDGITQLSALPVYDCATTGTAWGSITGTLSNQTDVYAAITAAESNAKLYADGLVVGLFDDRGNYNASSNAFPATGGSGPSGSVKRGDLWTVSVSGSLAGVSVEAGDVIRALVDSPGQTALNWSITERNFGYVPENSANKQNSLSPSSSAYPTVDAVNIGIGVVQGNLDTHIGDSSNPHDTTLEQVRSSGNVIAGPIIGLSGASLSLNDSTPGTPSFYVTSPSGTASTYVTDTQVWLGDANQNVGLYANLGAEDLGIYNNAGSITLNSDGTVSVASKRIVDVSNGSNANDAVNKFQLDGASVFATNRANHTGTQTASTISDFSSAAISAAPAETAATIGALIDGATTTAPADTQNVAVSAGVGLIKMTWGSVKLFFKTHFDTIYATIAQLNTKENSITPGTTSQYWRGDKTFQTLDKSAVGLGDVDNTSDANKPISTAMQTALNAKQPTINVTGILKGAGAGSVSAASAGDFPTLNQNTTGTAANITANSNTSLTSLPNLNIAQGQVSGLTTSLSGKQATINVTGLLKGAGAGSVVAASPGSDFAQTLEDARANNNVIQGVIASPTGGTINLSDNETGIPSLWIFHGLGAAYVNDVESWIGDTTRQTGFRRQDTGDCRMINNSGHLALLPTGNISAGNHQITSVLDATASDHAATYGQLTTAITTLTTNTQTDISNAVSNRPKVYYKSGQSVVCASTNVDEVMHSFRVPLDSITINSTIETYALTKNTSNGNQKTHKIYINSINSLSGAVLIGQLGPITNNNASSPFSCLFFVRTLTTIIKQATASTSITNPYLTVNTVFPTAVTVPNLGAEFYIFATSQRTNSGDTVGMDAFLVTINK